MSEDELHVVTFPCEDCGKTLTLPVSRSGHVDDCPHCGSYVDVPFRLLDPELHKPAIMAAEPIAGNPERPKSFGAGSNTSTTAMLWIEVLAVLALGYIPEMFSAVTSISGWLPAHQPTPFTYRMAYLIIRSLRVAGPLLFILACSGESWKSFGIVRPRWIVDVLTGCAVAFISIVAVQFAMLLIPRFMFDGLAAVHASHLARPAGTIEYILLVVAQTANGFAEELVMRAYLITRFRQLLSSTLAAVVITTALFASYHVYQGSLGVIGAAAIGLVFALCFCIFRRLWPLCIAHALYDVMFWL